MLFQRIRSSIHSFFLFFFFVPRPSTSLDVNIKVNVGDGEPIESALRRFKREVNKPGHLMELCHKKDFKNSQEKAKRKIKAGGSYATQV